MSTPIQDFLDEVGTSTIRINRIQKRKQVAGKSAVNIAKEKKDPLYEKYTKYRKLYLKAKDMIKRKYGRLGIRHAREIMK
jgi:hypothetical protein